MLVFTMVLQTGCNKCLYLQWFKLDNARIYDDLANWMQSMLVFTMVRQAGPNFLDKCTFPRWVSKLDYLLVFNCSSPVGRLHTRGATYHCRGWEWGMSVKNVLGINPTLPLYEPSYRSMWVFKFNPFFCDSPSEISRERLKVCAPSAPIPSPRSSNWDQDRAKTVPKEVPLTSRFEESLKRGAPGN